MCRVKGVASECLSANTPKTVDPVSKITVNVCAQNFVGFVIPDSSHKPATFRSIPAGKVATFAGG